MKKQLIAILALLMVGIAMISAQEVNTLYFLENAPMRHKINPAFQPVSKVYVGILPIHYTSISLGNNALAFSDLVYKKDGKYITGLYPGETDKLDKRLRRDLSLMANAELAILNFGSRTKDSVGYFHVGLNERIEGTIALPGDIYSVINSGSDYPGGRTVNLKSLAMNISVVTELSGGYSRKINDQWTVGGKLKFLYGNAFMDLRTNSAYLKMYPDELQASINGDVNIAGPFNNLPDRIDKNNIGNITDNMDKSVGGFLKPKGFGGAVDLGFTYKPDKQFQIAVSVTDLGFIHWNSTTYSINGESTYTGPEMHYNELNSNTAEEQNTGLNSIVDTIGSYLSNFIQESLVGNQTGMGVNRMTNTRLHVGLDANFWDNKFGVGVYSQTQFRNRRVYEEVTLGLALRPINWFNLALSYSFINARWNSIGAGLSFMPYDGLNLTLMTDYIPFSYADISSNGKSFTVPYKVQGLNVGMGVTIVFGTNPSTAKRRVYIKDLEPGEK